MVAIAQLLVVQLGAFYHGRARGATPPYNRRVDAAARIAASPEEIEAALEVRRVVFIEGQGVDAALERDGQDGEAIHAIAYAGGRVAAVGRMLPQVGGDGTVGRVGRMAVLAEHRRKGLATAVLRALEAEARRRSWRGVELHAQAYVAELYAKEGYAAIGAPFYEAGIEHVTMTKAL